MKRIFLSNKSAIAKALVIGAIVIFIVVIIAVALIWNYIPTPTPAPLDVATPTPTSLETPTPTTASTPTPTPTLASTPAPLEVDLSDALAENLVQATIAGDSLQYVDITLESISDQLLEVTVTVGTVFEAQSASLQDMVVIESILFELEFNGDVSSRSVSVACASMELDAPSADDTLVMSGVPAANSPTSQENLLGSRQVFPAILPH